MRASKRRFEGGDEWYAGVVEAVDGDTYNVLYDDGDREIGIAAAFMRKEGSTESSADDAPSDAPDPAPVETALPPPRGDNTAPATRRDGAASHQTRDGTSVC